MMVDFFENHSVALLSVLLSVALFAGRMFLLWLEFRQMRKADQDRQPSEPTLTKTYWALR